MKTQLYLLSYDIKETRRRTKLAKELLNYGSRVQYSVFEAQLTPQDVFDIMERVGLLLDPETDSFLVYPLCQRCKKGRMTLGKATLNGSYEDPIAIL